MWVRALADAAEDAGGKARGLARAIAAGLRVPEGFVVESGAFAAIAHPPLDEIGHELGRIAERIRDAELPVELAEVETRARALGGRLAVRSSATIEDRVAGAAPGVFASITDVSVDELWLAIRSVWTSALTPLAVAYARGQPFAMAVIVHRYVPGERATVYTRPPGSPGVDELWIQRGERLDRVPRNARDPIVLAALAAERAIEAGAGADVELVLGDGEPWVVQVRPIVHPPTPVRGTPPPSSVLGALVADGRVWTWDVAHNPDPLSAAQAELVERVERAGFGSWSLRVCAGYLYSAPRGEPPIVTIASRAELDARAAELEGAFAEILDVPADDDIERAIERYLAFYRRWATELVPLIRAARRDLVAADLAGARPSAVELTILAAARGEIDDAAVLDRIGVMSPAWDVAAPTFAEDPARIRATLARARAGRMPDPAPVAGGDELARGGADLAERDDVWFARAQWLVRRAILARAAAIGLSPDDAFWIPPGDLRSTDLDLLRRRAAGARAAADRAATWTMPLVVGRPDDESRPSLVGIGSGGCVNGRVVRIGSLARAATIAVGHGDVIVARAITPALAVIVIGCAAIVSETGGLLDHGAAMARELGIPCVVGCRDAWSLLSDGMLVTVNGDAGTVTC